MYKDTNLNETPESNNRGVHTKLSFISISNQHNNSTAKKVPLHSKNVSQFSVPKQQLAVGVQHRSNCSENQDNLEGIALEDKKPRKKKRSKQKSKLHAQL